MERDFIPYEEAVELKALGFDEPCFGYYISLGDNKENPFKLIEIQSEKGQFEWTDNVYYAPLYQQAFRWFRDNHGLKHDIDDHVGAKFYYKIKSFTDKYDNYDDIVKLIREEKDPNKIEFNSYEEAEIECLKKLIEIVKKKK
jgi:hypothetical protein